MTESPEHTRGDELLTRVLSGDEWGSGVGNELLQQFGDGYPVEKLSTLLQSDNEKAIEDGVWIASELGAGAKPILGDLLPLYDYPNRRIKYYAVELALTAATEQEGEVIAHAVMLIRDPERPVRRASFELLTRAESARLAASLPYIDDQEIVVLLEWALGVESDSRDDDEIAVRLRESDELGRLFAAVAAARVYRRNPHYLELAASLGESDTQSLAASELAWLSKLDEQAQRRRKRADRKNG
jgi:hypothetical protein